MLATHATTSTATTTPFALEFQALKDELQRTLARLGAAEVPREVRHSPSSPWSEASSVATTTTTLTPTSAQPEALTARGAPPIGDATTRVLRELVATARRRRQIEMHIARELERDLQVRHDDDLPGARQPDVRRDRDEAIRREIGALRLRRKQIMHMIDVESRDEAAQTPHSSHTYGEHEDLPNTNQTSSLPASIKQSIQGEYSIEGVVKLGGSLELSSVPMSSHTGVGLPRRDVQTSYDRPMPQVFNRQHQHDMMQDVFAIQLKFAETMLKLEKSIQLRDHLLVPPTSSRRSQNRRRDAPSRRRSRPPSTIHEDIEMDPADSSDDDQGMLPQTSSDESSLSEDAMRMWRRYRANRQRTPPQRSTRNMGESIATTTASTTPDSQPSPVCPDESTASTPPRTSQHDAGLVTPISNDSSGKQVRFDEAQVDEYPTPQIARNISFDQASIDSSDEDGISAWSVACPSQRKELQVGPKRVGVVSSDDEVMSFMEGSSVCSSDLNDESFLIAFNSLRKELQREHAVSYKSAESFPRSSPRQRADLYTETESVESTTAKSQMVADPVEIKDLVKRKRDLVLDIQSTTAKLVLSTDKTNGDQLRRALDRLRLDLDAIETHIAEASASCHIRPSSGDGH